MIINKKICIFFIMINFLIYAENNEIKIGNDFSEISFRPSYGNLLFSTDKFDNLYILDKKNNEIKIYNNDYKYINSNQINLRNVDIKEIRIVNNKLVGYTNERIFSSYIYMNKFSEFISKKLYIENKLYIVKDKIVSFTINNNEVKTYDLNGTLLYKSSGIYIDDSIKVSPNFELFSDFHDIDYSIGGSILIYFDTLGYSYWYNPSINNLYLVIIDPKGNLVNTITIKKEIDNKITNSIGVGYWGDIYIVRTVGKYIEPDYSGNPGKFPSSYSFEKIHNTWSYSKGQYLAELCDIGLTNDNESVIVKLINSLTKDELRKFRNTLFAKKGYIFKSDDLNLYFNNFDWYKPNEEIKGTKDILTDNQISLFELILKYENMK